MTVRSSVVAFVSCILLAGGVRAQEISDPFLDGRKLFGDKKYEEALQKFHKSLEYLPHDPTILSWIGATEMSLSHYALAEQALAEAVGQGGTAYKFFELLAASQARQNKWDAALATAKRYREVAPDAEKQENEEKLRTFEGAVHLEKRLECLRREPPDIPGADAELEAAWKLKPKDPAQVVSFAQIWMSKGLAEKDPEKKSEFFGHAEEAARTWVAAASPSDMTRARAALGSALVRQKKYEEAIGVLGEAVKADPSNCSLRLDLARAYLGKEDYAHLKAAASDAITCRPEEPQGYFLRATAEFSLDDCPAVVKDGGEYVKRSPGKEEPKFIKYCRNVMDWKKAEADRHKQMDDYSKWVKQQLEEGDRAVEESLPKPKKQPDREKKP